MQSDISGTVMPVLRILLESRESILAETGEFAWKSSHVVMQTVTGGAGQSGFFGVVTRALAGGGLFMTRFTAPSQPGLVAFNAKIPGHITEHTLQGQAYLVHRHGFIAGTEDVRMELAFQRNLGAGVFGGDGFRLQRLSGSGRFWCSLGGEVITHDRSYP